MSSSFLPPAFPARGIVPFQDDNKYDVTARGGEGGLGSGIVFVGRELQTTPPECTSGYVYCVNGFTTGGQSCKDACIDGTTAKCCDGNDACYKFTGKVCKDGNSCMSDSVCYKAKIPWVVNSCKGGYQSCIRAGYAGGTVGNMINSCHGKYSCSSLGNAGQVGYIRNSCLGEKACHFAGYSGGVGNIIGSCNAQQACKSLGEKVQTLISSDLNSCCNSANICFGFSSLPANCDAATASPSASPTASPSASPTASPSTASTTSPSAAPTATPTMAKSAKKGTGGKASKEPTSAPTASLSPTISGAPTKAKAGKKTVGKIFNLFN